MTAAPRSGGTVVILGSAPDALRARDWPRAGLDHLVAINNAWRVRPDWDHMIHPKDFPPERRPPAPRAGQSILSYPEYVPVVNSHGGFVFCGGTMAFTAAYWALGALKPRIIAFLGCDMVYPASGSTHFYGTGAPDPLRDDLSLRDLGARSARFALIAAAAGCAAVNLSTEPESRLLLPRIDISALRAADAIPSPALRAGVASLRHAEAALGYDVPSGRYWREAARFDPAALADLDRRWRRLLDATGLAPADPRNPNEETDHV